MVRSVPILVTLNEPCVEWWLAVIIRRSPEVVISPRLEDRRDAHSRLLKIRYLNENVYDWLGSKVGYCRAAEMLNPLDQVRRKAGEEMNLLLLKYVWPACIRRADAYHLLHHSRDLIFRRFAHVYLGPTAILWSVGRPHVSTRILFGVCRLTS